MRKLTYILASVLFLLSCNPAENFGEKIKVEKSEVYYKGEVDKKEAQALGDYLLENGWFDEESTKSAQLTKKDDEYIVRLVVDKDKLEDSEQSLNYLWIMQLAISQNVFDKAPTRIVLTDEKLKDLEDYTLDPIAEYKAAKDAYILYNSEAFKKADVKKLAAAFEKEGFLAYQGEKTILLNKNDEGNVVRLLVDKKVVSKSLDAFLPVYKKLLYSVQENAFDGDKTSLYLTSKADYADFKKVPKASREEIEQLQQLYTPANEQSINESETTSPVEDESSEVNSGQ